MAIAHKKLLLGQRFCTSSPNGKFKEGAAAINGQVLARIEAHGKNIFYFFTQSKLSKQAGFEDLSEDATVVHIHFGMSGSFQTFSFPGPEPRPATRLRLVAEKVGVVAHLSASVCKHGSIELYRKKVESLGPDPLRKDGDKERFWASLQKSRKNIGALLMDQSIIAGIGNIYRTELLFVVGVHPDQPASSLMHSTFEQIWSEAQRLLQVGVVTGSIITVSQDEAGKPFSKLRKGEKRYIYNHKQCQRCDGLVQSWKSAQRTVYACESCQPLMPSGTPKSYQKTQESKDKTCQEDVTVMSLHSSKAPGCDVTATTMVLQDKQKSRNVKLRKRAIEHQAFKDITTGGLSDFDSFNDVILQSFAPTTPQKPASSEGTGKAQKRKRRI